MATGVVDALEKVFAITRERIAEFHGPKMDGSMNDIELALFDIENVCTNAFNELNRLLDTLPPFHESDRYDYKLTPDSLVWDVGGFKGDFAVEVFRRYGCNIVCFEPVFHTELAKRLRALGPRVKVFPHGLGRSNRTEVWNVRGDSTGAFSPLDERGKEEVAIRDIEELLVADVGLMKLNVEGMEFEILETLFQRGLLTRFKNIQVQFHDCAIQAKERYASLQRLLARTHHLTLYAGWVWQSWERNE